MFRNACLLIFLLMQCNGGLRAWAQVSIPPDAQPGAIQNYGVQQFNLQRSQPWLYRPLYPDDITPQEPDVRWMQTEGQILEPTNSSDDSRTPPENLK